MASILAYSLAADAQAPRREHDFCAHWRFHKGDAAGAQRPDFDDGDWERVALPHCFNAEDTFTPERGYYRGPAWYRKRFRVEGLDASRRAHLVFEGSFAVTTVWLNGWEVASSVDGYTGMAIDIAEALAAGENVVAVRVDNTHDPDVLPGLEQPDYNLYGGIYREVSVIATDDLHVPRGGLRVRTPEVSRGEAAVEATVRLRSSAARPVLVRATVTAPDGRQAARAEATAAVEPGDTAIELTFPRVAEPSLWSPETPDLYDMVVEVWADGELADRAEERFGLRWFEFDLERGLLLNGEHVRLVGVNRHQDYPGLGNALPPRLQRADAEIIKEMDANFVRCSHYPQHAAFLDACDELGICVYEEIASWQFIGGRKFADNAEAMMRAMIRRDANHPSIILWGLLNEGRDRRLFEWLNAAAHQEDPSRPTIYAENKPEEGIPLGTVWVPDVLGLNYKLPHLDELREELADRRMLSSEHTNACTPDPADPAQCAEQTDRIDGDLEILAARPWVAGSALWCMHDYGTDYDPSWPVQRSGALDEYRRPKESYYLLCARWRKDAFVHIEGHWNPMPDETGPRRVRAYTNCEKVMLRLNGRDLGEHTEGFIRTWEVPFEPGRLEAVGERDGVEVRDEVRTHGAPAQLRLEAGAPELAGPGDACVLTATLLDADGAPVLAGQHEVAFTATGPVRIRGVGGKPTARSIRGVARIALTAEGPGKGVVEASCGGIRSAAVGIGVGHRSGG